MIDSSLDFKNLVLSGGGGKGAAYPGALQALEETGILQNIRNVAGTSAGSMVAALISDNFSATEIKNIIANDNIGGLATTIDWSWAPTTPITVVNVTYGGRDFQNGLVVNNTLLGTGAGIFDGNALYEYFQEKLYKNADTYLINNKDTAKTTLQSEGLDAGWVDSFIGRTTPTFTFSDLAKLDSVDPVAFKNLTITGFDTGTQSDLYYSASSTPDMQVALAVRLSMSIPVAFKGVFWQDESQRYHLMQDGGLYSNTPTEVFMGSYAYMDRNQLARELANNQDLQKKFDQTLVLAFDNNGMAKEAMTSKTNEGLQNKSFFEGLFGATDFGTVTDWEKIYNSRDNVLVVPHPGLSTGEFFPSPSVLDNAQTQAYKSAMAFIDEKKNGAGVDVYESTLSQSTTTGTTDTVTSMLGLTPTSSTSDALMVLLARA